MEEIKKYDFTNGDDLSDFKLIVDNKNIFVHKAILGIVSPVFYMMFTSDFKEKKNGEAILHGKKFEDVIELLELIYPNYEKKVNETHAESLLQLSHEYQITSVKILVENTLIAKEVKIEQQNQQRNQQRGNFRELGETEKRISDITNLLNLSDLYALKKLKAICLNNLSTKFTKIQLEENTLFMELDLNNRMEIYRKKIDRYESY